MSKPYPTGYSTAVQRVLREGSFSEGKDIVILGSGSLRSQQYAADVDAYEDTQLQGKSKADAVRNATRKFQSIIRHLLGIPFTYIMDIKCGSVEDWVVIPKDATVEKKTLLGFNPKQSLDKVEALYKDGIITLSERNNAFDLLRRKMTPSEFLNVKQELRYNLVRWTPQEVLEGQKTYRTKTIKLSEAIQQPTIMKLDLVILDQGRFVEVSIIYELRWKSERINDFPPVDITQSIRENVLHYWKENNAFKMAKRIFSLARFTKKQTVVNKLIPFFNSDLGRLYAIISDIDTLIALLETATHIPVARMKEELGNIPSRLANVWTLKDFLLVEPDLVAKLQKTISHPLTDNTIDRLNQVNDILREILQKHSKQELTKLKLYPPPTFYLP